MREQGWYWVRDGKEWFIARWAGLWYIAGYCRPCNDLGLSEIGDKIELPNKYKECVK